MVGGAAALRASEARVSFFMLVTPLVIGGCIPAFIFLGEIEEYIGQEYAEKMRSRDVHFLISIYCLFNIFFRHHVEWFSDAPVFSKQNLAPFAAKTFYAGLLMGELIIYMDQKAQKAKS